ncbi:hypothetical protein R6Q59_034940 [Mikania micrantha]
MQTKTSYTIGFTVKKNFKTSSPGFTMVHHLTKRSCKTSYTIGFTVKKNFKTSNTRVHHGSTTITNRSCKVQCQSQPKLSHVDEPRDEELHGGPSRALEGVVRCSVNYIPLSPISFLERAAEVYKDRTSVIYGSIKYTWKETHRRCVMLACALNHLGISRGDVVAVLAPNIPAMLELHFAVPMTGAIICALNTRLDPKMLSTHLSHSEAKILFVDYQLLQIAEEAISLLKNTETNEPPLLVTISELNSFDPSMRANKHDYESLVSDQIGDTTTTFSIVRPNDECDPISLSYTSGTTSRPKGVIFSHRGAYLNSLASVFTHGMRDMSTYLCSLPMFHCNGWCSNRLEHDRKLFRNSSS